MIFTNELFTWRVDEKHPQKPVSPTDHRDPWTYEAVKRLIHTPLWPRNVHSKVFLPFITRARTMHNAVKSDTFLARNSTSCTELKFGVIVHLVFATMRSLDMTGCLLLYNPT